MKTIEVSAEFGREYGHVPGHQYHDVTVTITRKPGRRWRVDVLETWGSCQGHDEEHGRREVVGMAAELEDAVRRAKELATDAGIETGYLVQALSRAEADADEAEHSAKEEA